MAESKSLRIRDWRMRVSAAAAFPKLYEMPADGTGATTCTICGGSFKEDSSKEESDAEVSLDVSDSSDDEDTLDVEDNVVILESSPSTRPEKEEQLSLSLAHEFWLEE